MRECLRESRLLILARRAIRREGEKCNSSHQSGTHERHKKEHGEYHSALHKCGIATHPATAHCPPVRTSANERQP
eukprot:2938864-Pyramimonas_sp.AAC.1